MAHIITESCEVYDLRGSSSRKAYAHLFTQDILKQSIYLQHSAKLCKSINHYQTYEV